MTTHVRQALAVSVATLTAAWVAYASHGGTSHQLLGVIALLLVNTCLVVWLAVDAAFESLKTLHVLITAVALGAIGMLAQPLLEDDHFRYLWDGYITATTGKPFAHAPSHYFPDVSVPAVMQDALSGINNPETPTIYGPVLQALFALCYWVAPAEIWPLKLALLGALVAVILMLSSAGVPARWLMVLALHPLVVKESAMTAHPDILIGAALLAAVLAWQRSNEALAACLAAIAVATKFSAAPALLFFCISRDGRVSWRGSLATGIALFVLYAPVLLSASGTGQAGASALAQQWTFNPLLFKIAAVALGDTAARWACLGLFALVWLVLAVRWIRQLRALALIAPAPAMPFTPTLATTFTTTFARPSPPLVGVFVAMLLLSPVVNPWYWLWVLPLALLPLPPILPRLPLLPALQFGWVAWVGATVSLFSYAHVLTQVLAASSITTYSVPMWATGLQLFVIATAIVCVLNFSNPQRGKRI